MSCCCLWFTSRVNLGMNDVLLPISCAAACIALYLTVSKGLAAGGWSPLYNDFKEPDKAAPETWLTAATDIGRTHYQAGLRVAIAEDGLHLRQLIPLLLFHRPLMIPWQAITRCGELPSRRNREMLLSIGTSHGPIKIGFRYSAAKTISDSIPI